MANPNKDLHIAVIGAGMGGLACALALAKEGFTHIDVYEAASNLGFVGAGIQLAPNMARILDRLGCWKDIEAEAVDVKQTSIRQGDTNDELALVDLRYIRKQYSHPHMVGHRSSLAGGIYEGCKKEKAITFHFATAVSEVTSWSPKPTFVATPRKGGGDPYEVQADVVLAADGIKSVVRDQMLSALGHHDAKVIDTEQAAYRIMLKRSQMEHDPDLLPLIDTDQVIRWIGEKRHVIAYPVSHHQIYNISTLQPDVNFASATNATYTTKGSKTQMLQVFSDFHPIVHKLLANVPDGDVCEWKLRVHSPLPTWTHGSIALVGDACHPTLPHLSQGAAQAIEDAAVLATVLRLMPLPLPLPLQSQEDSSSAAAAATKAKTISHTLKIYERIRKPRAYTLADLAAQSGRDLQLGEGAAREERDRAFRAALASGGGTAADGGTDGGTDGGAGVNVPDKWADKDVQSMAYTWDAYEEAKRGFAELWGRSDLDGEEVVDGMIS